MCGRCIKKGCGGKVILNCKECGFLCVACEKVKHADARLREQHSTQQPPLPVYAVKRDFFVMRWRFMCSWVVFLREE
jgi:hypothetical protein